MRTCQNSVTNSLRSLQFECIQKLEGHHGEVWAVAVSNKGTFVATAAHDKSIRIWEKLDDPVGYNIV